VAGAARGSPRGAMSRRSTLAVLRRLLEARRSAAGLSRRAMRCARGCGSSSRRPRAQSQVDLPARRHRPRLLRRREPPLDRGALPRGEEGESPGGLRDRLPHAQAAQEVGLAARAPLRRRSGALRGDREREPASRPHHLRALREIVEFASHELERLQERIGRFLGFTVGRHRMELYGICAACREGRGTSPGASGACTGSEAPRIPP